MFRTISSGKAKIYSVVVSSRLLSSPPSVSTRAKNAQSSAQECKGTSRQDHKPDAASTGCWLFSVRGLRAAAAVLRSLLPSSLP